MTIDAFPVTLTCPRNAVLKEGQEEEFVLSKQYKFSASKANTNTVNPERRRCAVPYAVENGVSKYNERVGMKMPAAVVDYRAGLKDAEAVGEPGESEDSDASHAKQEGKGLALRRAQGTTGAAGCALEA